MTIDIIGAGIGGLTTAIALQKRNIDYRIFEQAKEMKPVGAGIILANNAMQIYDRLGLRNEIEKNGNAISSFSLTDRQLSPLAASSLQHFEEKYGVRNVAIHRGKLQELLINNLKGKLILDHKLKNIEKAPEGYSLHFENSVQLQSNCILAADGIYSTVRKLLFEKSEIRDALQMCWRGLADYTLPDKYQHEVNEAWGYGERFGFVKIYDKKVYWFAVKSITAQSSSEENFSEYFKDFHPLVKDLLAHTPKEKIHVAKLEDLKPMKNWWRNKVCLLGDAAHATTPNLGQGACQSIEDAYFLAKAIVNNKNDLNKAFQEFQQKRIRKANGIAKTSYSLGKIAHWKNPIAVRMRNNTMRLTPPSTNRKQMEKIFNLEL